MTALPELNNERAVAVDVPDLSVVVPCLNEEANVGLLAERVLAATAEAGIETELVFVDDGSTDGTWEAIEAIRAQQSAPVTNIRHQQNRGIAASWRSGLDAAAGSYVCFLDADLQHPPEEVVTLYRRLLESRDDIVQGTRSSIERVHDSRYAFSRGLNLLLNLVFRMRATDSKSGFVLGPRRVLQDVIEHRLRYRFFQSFIHVAARAKGYSVLEVETLFQSRHAGRSFLAGKAWSVVFGALADFVPAIREYGWSRRPLGESVAPHARPLGPTQHPYRGWRRLWFEAYWATTPLHKWMISRRARRLYLELKMTERLPREELQQLQLVKLQRLVQHAYAHVPFYRDAMRSRGVKPDAIKTLDDVRELPLLSKQDVRQHLYFDLFADDHRKREMLRIVTSGSTGEPFVTYADRYQLEMRFATTLRALEWAGWRFGDRQARLWHQTIGMTRRQVIRERIDAWFMRRLFVPAYEMNSNTLEEFVAKIRRHKPVLVDGYAESFNFLATYVREGGVAGFSPKAIMSSAQSLPEQSRELIEEAFRTRVLDKYGSREFSGIAYECGAARDHHVMDESYLVEILVDGRTAKPGEIGEIVITDLNNYSVPLIRYRIGDLATAVDNETPCPCGRHLSRIGRIEGRTQAIVRCVDGTWLPGGFFSHLFKEYEFAIRHFQVVQEAPGGFVVKIVRNARFTQDVLDEIVSELQRFTGHETRIDFEFVDEIPLGRTGKRTPVVSTIAEDFQELQSPNAAQPR